MTYRNARDVGCCAGGNDGPFRCSTQGSWADSGCPSEASLKSEAGKQETNIAFKNQGTAAIDIYWIDYDVHLQHYSKLMPGGSQNFQTYATHPLDSDGRDRDLPRCLDFRRRHQRTVTIEP